MHEGYSARETHSQLHTVHSVVGLYSTKYYKIRRPYRFQPGIHLCGASGMTTCCGMVRYKSRTCSRTLVIIPGTNICAMSSRQSRGTFWR